jgi:hypothetical protein
MFDEHRHQQRVLGDTGSKPSSQAGGSSRIETKGNRTKGHC